MNDDKDNKDLKILPEIEEWCKPMEGSLKDLLNQHVPAIPVPDLKELEEMLSEDTITPVASTAPVSDQEKAIMDIIQNAKISGMKGLISPEYFKELEISLRESKIPLDPLPKSMNDFLTGGVPVGQMLCISGPNFAHNEAFMKLAINSMGRSYKTNILQTLMFNSMSEGEKIVFDEIDVTERFKEKIALTIDSLSMVDMGQRTGKSMLSLQAVEEIVETMRNLHPCTKQKEFILTEVPDHKSKSYYDRKPKYDPKPSPLLMGLIKNPGV